MKACNECGQPAQYWDKGYDDGEGDYELESFWCKEHKHFKPGAEPLPFTGHKEPKP